MTTWDELVSGEELDKVSKSRRIKYKEIKVEKESIAEHEKKGWKIFRRYKDGSAKMRAPKEIGDAFEDEVWTIFYDMGFEIMNKSNGFKLSYSKGNPDLTKQIDVIAIDDEVILLVECKAADKPDTTGNWKKELESIQGFFPGLCKEIRQKYKNRKVKYILATKNYLIGEQDNKRMEEFKIANFNHEVVTYYAELVKHLGSAARYQLLGNLFAKQRVENMIKKIPAIEGRMGGLKYYTFLIEPEKLLKISYILHRSKANHKMMPTYQRLIKKDRLKAIRKFVNEGGYFPNSIIVSIDTVRKEPRFELLTSKLDNNNNSRAGYLYLPGFYQSVYIIDGQHRLYGYSDTKYANNNTIPVVAFLNLSKNEQVKLFMDINQNQKSVSKSLRNTLNVDLLWDSEDANERKLALMLGLAQSLGEDPTSPLFQRIITGEDKITEKRCITIDYIKEAVANSSFLNIYKKGKNEIIQHGTFDKDDNDRTLDFLLSFLKKSLKLMSEFLQEEWEKGSSGYITINNTMYGIIKIIDDIVNMTLKKEKKQIVDNADEFYKKCEPLLYKFIETLSSLDSDSVKTIKEAKGGAAKKISWRTLQVAFYKKEPCFTNPELEQYIIENCTDNNPDASEYLFQIEMYLKGHFKEQLEKNNDWMNNMIPESLTNQLISKKAIEENNRKKMDNYTEVDVWDFISFDEIKQIATYKTNWSDFCSTILSSSKIKSTKVDAITWLSSFSRYKSKITTEKNILTSELKDIRDIYNMFFLNQIGDEKKT
ncbi:MAG: DGQHR domain-containing protein [Bacilli bacterium]